MGHLAFKLKLFLTVHNYIIIRHLLKWYKHLGHLRKCLCISYIPVQVSYLSYYPSLI